MSFKTILEACFQVSLDSEQKESSAALAQSLLETNTTIKQLENYLSESGIRAQCAVIEKEYLDKNFSDDYSSYYGGCFRDCPRKCCRVHFFNECYDQSSMQKMLLLPEEDDALRKFKKSYLGFVVIRPLQKAIVGRTCIVPYPCKEKALESGRHYPAVCKNDVSFFGIKMTVECMPFQEQDCGTSACATCALWSSFCVSAKMFGNKSLSPSAITTIAMENGYSVGTRFPNRGLMAEEMVYVMRRTGLEPVIAHLKGCDKSELEYLFPGFVYAYLNLGVSVIAIIEDVSGGGKHAVAVNGYNLKDDNGEVLSAMRIDKYYANDDQCCPGARFRPVLDDETLRIEAYHGSSIATKLDKTYNLECLMVPLYHKIRVTFNEIAELVLNANGILFFADLCCRPCNKALLAAICKTECFIKAFKGLFVVNDSAGIDIKYDKIPYGNKALVKMCAKELMKEFDEYRQQGKRNIYKEKGTKKIIQWDVTIKASNDIKDEFRRVDQVSERGRVEFLEKPLPRYIWCIRVRYDNKDSAIIFIDATDSVRGLCVVGVVFFDREIQDIARYAYANNRNVVADPLIKALCAYCVKP